MHVQVEFCLDEHGSFRDDCLTDHVANDAHQDCQNYAETDLEWSNKNLDIGDEDGAQEDKVASIDQAAKEALRVRTVSIQRDEAEVKDENCLYKSINDLSQVDL